MKIFTFIPLLCFFIEAQILLVVSDHIAPASVDGKRIVCFYNSRDSAYMTPYNYQPKDIPMELCTDLIFASANIDSDTWEVVPPPRIRNMDIMRQFTALATRTPTPPNFFLSVGGAFHPHLWSEMTSDASKRLAFITSVLHLIQDYGFNGLNLFWGEPRPSDRANYVKLVEELVEEKPEHLLLTSAVQLGSIVHYYINETRSGFNIQRLSELFDWINVVDHILRAPWKNHYVDVPSPLYRRQFDGNEGSLAFLNLHDGLDIMERLGAPRNKLMLGIPFSGLTYTLRSSSDTFLTALTNTSANGGNPGHVTKTRGFLYYYEICRLLTSGKWNKRFDHEGKCPYAFFRDQWIGYEDEQSIKIKMAYVKHRGYGGANVWAVNMDDFNGFCGSKNPLLHAVHAALKEKEHHNSLEGSVEEVLLKRYQAMGIDTCKMVSHRHH